MKQNISKMALHTYFKKSPIKIMIVFLLCNHGKKKKKHVWQASFNDTLITHHEYPLI